MRARFLPPILATVLVLTAPALAEPDERRMEEIALGWVEAHNSGEVEKMAAYRATHRKGASQDWQDSFHSLVERMGRLEIIDVFIEEDGEIVFGFESENSGRGRLRFLFDPDHPEQVTSIRLGLGESRPNPLPELATRGDWEARGEALDHYLTKLAEDGVFSGVVLVADGETLRFEGAYGLASREFEIPNTLHTRFDIGSITKDFTRVAIAQLAAAGKLEIDDPLGKHLPDYPNAEARDKVTIRHLFEHTSGVADYFTEEWGQTPMGALRDHDDYIRIWGPKPLLFAPGDRDEYSNFGFTVLGAILDAVSGQPYFDYVAEHVFEPAGMTDSGFFATDEIVPDVAVGYTFMRRDGERGPTPRKNIYLEPVVGGPWGKTYCTARDLWRFWLALSRHQLTDPAYTGWVLLSSPPPAPGEVVADAEPIRGVGLGGGGPGLTAELEVVDDRLVIVLANQDPPTATQLAQRIRQGLRGAE